MVRAYMLRSNRREVETTVLPSGEDRLIPRVEVTLKGIAAIAGCRFQEIVACSKLLGCSVEECAVNCAWQARSP